MIGLCLVGCGAKPASNKQEEKPKAEPLLKNAVTINAEPGEAEVRDASDKRVLLYKVSWQKASVSISNDGPFASAMETVAGSLFDNGTEASHFQAKSASANKEKNLLKLYGGVNVNSNSYKMKIHCDSLEYRAGDKLVVARGHIRAEGENGVLTGPEEIWATPDLKVIATPKEFKRP